MSATNRSQIRINGKRIMFLSMIISLCLFCWDNNNNIQLVEAFTTTKTTNRQPRRFLSRYCKAYTSALHVSSSTDSIADTSSSSSTAGKGFGPSSSSSSTTTAEKAEPEVPLPAVTTPIEEKVSAEILSLPIGEIKDRLLDLLPRMTGQAEEFAAVESYINALEDKYVPVQTLDFLNLAMGGEWQLLFSTNLLGPPNRSLRLREMFQKVETNNLEGKLTNEVVWDLAEDETTFDASGKFSVKCSYSINQGARMIVDLNDHEINLAPGSKVPTDVQGLVGMIHRAMPKEMFDPNELAMDTTYLDGDLRIVRMSGSRHEGARNIFIRRGSIEIDPTK